MEKMNYWRLCDQYTLVQAALLIVGVDPDEAEDVMSREVIKRPRGLTPVLSALSADIRNGKLPAEAYSEISKMDFIPDEIKDQICVELATICVRADDIKKWLKKRGIKSDVFSPQPSDQPDYLDENHPHYSPKLAAAIDAWQAVTTDPSLRNGKSVKQALAHWLHDNAEKYRLINEDGTLNELGIAEVAKIANWAKKGGAPRTPD